MYEHNEEKFLELISKIPNVAVQGYDKNRKVIYWNKASEDIYGFTLQEALGKRLEDLIIPYFMREAVILDIRNWYKNDIKIPATELPLQHKNGSTIHVFSSHVILNKNTDNPELFCLDIDLTEQKKQEQKLKEKDKILQEQSKMASMGQMLENIAHQWRQPLSIASSSIGGIKIQHDLEILNEEYLIDSLNSIETNIQYMSQTIDDFRDFIKGEHKKTNFNILDILNKCLKLLEGIVKKDFLTIHYKEEDFNTIITAYPNSIIQVIINMICNAKDAFNQNNCEHRNIFISLKREKENIYIIIKDNAGGVPTEIINKIFEQKFTTKGKDGGSGIGLFMSLRLIKESMGGDIKVNNVSYEYNKNKFKGAEFIVTLPLI
jgi:PAS domain S-box-containing protein